jgi:hypothetical protein
VIGRLGVFLSLEKRAVAGFLEELSASGQVPAFLADGEPFAGAKPGMGDSSVILPLLLWADSIGDPERFRLVIGVVGVDVGEPEKLERPFAEAFFADSGTLVPKDGWAKTGFELVSSGFRLWWFAHGAVKQRSGWVYDVRRYAARITGSLTESAR